MKNTMTVLLYLYLFSSNRKGDINYELEMETQRQIGQCADSA